MSEWQLYLSKLKALFLLSLSLSVFYALRPWVASHPISSFCPGSCHPGSCLSQFYPSVTLEVTSTVPTLSTAALVVLEHIHPIKSLTSHTLPEVSKCHSMLCPQHTHGIYSYKFIFFLFPL